MEARANVSRYRMQATPALPPGRRRHTAGLKPRVRGRRPGLERSPRPTRGAAGRLSADCADGRRRPGGMSAHPARAAQGCRRDSRPQPCGEDWFDESHGMGRGTGHTREVHRPVTMGRLAWPVAQITRAITADDHDHRRCRDERDQSVAAQCGAHGFFIAKSIWHPGTWMCPAAAGGGAASKNHAFCLPRAGPGTTPGSSASYKPSRRPPVRQARPESPIMAGLESRYGGPI